MNSRLIIAATDINGTPVLVRWFNGKIAREIYRCAKGIILTGSLAKPVGFAIAQIPRELSKGMVCTVVGERENIVGYLCSIGFVRYIYKLANPGKIKATARFLYNFGSLPLTLYAKGVGNTFDLLKLSEMEELWFGQPVYIFNDNRIWIESNFTISNIVEKFEESQ